MPQLRFNRKVLSTTRIYRVFPRGIAYPTATEALKQGGRVREYTTVIKQIEIITEKGGKITADGTYVTSKDIREPADATLPEKDLPL